ncbi:MAG: hypothetical protein HYU48_02340 [Candidatus Levybacteria bacterium]|nr:hypothetical protein [Candidatus Levybacteria bacterium]
MKKGQQRARKNINFRETHSERSATASYRNFGPIIKRNQNQRSFGRGK